jgi:diguanylate cyclase (GGDEF)-like protein
VAAVAAAAALPASLALVPAALAAAVASVSCAGAVTRAGNRRARVAWTAQTAGCVCWTVAAVAWQAGASPLGALPSAGRAGFLACAGTGFWLACRGPDRRARLRMLLDGGVAAGAVFVVASAAAAGRTSTAITFPLVALALNVFCLFLTLTEFRPGKRRMPAWYISGLFLIAAADLRAALDSTPGPPAAAAWCAGFACVALSGRAYGGTTRRQSVPTTSGWLAYTPYLPLACAVATVAVQAVPGARLTAPELTGAGLVVLLVLLRQVLMLAENRTLVARLAARERELRHQALHCPLTGLGNRLLLTTRLQETLDDPARRPAALLFCDLDDFKRVNDTLGHDAGDELLSRVGERLRAALRPDDTVARLGGDEFAVLLPACPALEARSLADGVWQAFQSPFPVAGRPLSLSASVGLVMVSNETSATEVLKAADTAMYEVKRAGKNGVHEVAS